MARDLSERERMARDLSERERMARDLSERERMARDLSERERMARDLSELERMARDLWERERMARDLWERERMARDLWERERMARDLWERERMARDLSEEGYGQEFVGGGYGQEFVGGGYGQEFVGAYPQGHIEYTARQSNPVGTYSSKQLDSATSLQLHSAYGHHSVTSESDSYAAAVTPQQVSSLYQTFENCDYSPSTEPPSQSLPGELAKLRIHGPQETFQRRPPQRADERWHSKRTGTYTTHSPMQRAVGGHQVQAQQIGYETSVQSQPVTSGLYGYGAESSSDHGKAPRRPYSGSSKNKWPPTTPSGFYTKSQSSSDESYQQGFSRGSWNSNNERKVSESHRPGTSQVSSPSQSSPSMDGATSTSGTVASTKVRANHFQLKMQTNIVLYRYSVEIRQVDENGKTLPEGEKVGTSAKLRAFAVFANALDDQRPIFDGQESFYSMKDLQQGRTKIVSLGGEKDKRHYSVRIHDRKELQHSGHWTSLAADFVQALDVAIRCALSNDRMRIGRLLFGKEDDEKLVKRFGETGLEPYRGVLTSARRGQSEMFLNVDTILTGFYKTCPLTDLLQGLGNTVQTIACPLNEVCVKFLKSLIGFKIEVRHQGYTRVRKIESITPETAAQLKLGEPKDSTTGSIAEYFDKYGGLQYPDLPCVKVVSSRTCYYPLEKCFLKLGQKGTSKLPCELARPKERFEFAINIVNELIEKREQYFSPFVKEIVPEPVETEYKILPILQTSRTTVLAGEVKWKIVNTCETNAYIEDFINGIQEVGGEMGVAMSDPMLEGRRPPGIKPDQNDHSGFHIVVFVLNRKNSVHYPRIKYLAEIKCGLITQCVVQSIKMKGRNFQMNVMRKIKAKLGVVDKAMPVDKLSFEDFLVMGADVSHHSPNESKPSVAAIVASIDDCASRYVAAIRPQQKFNNKKRVETIMEMTSMAKELFGYCAEKLRKNPKHILFYRDGVSEGEFRNVCGTELANLKRACRNAFGVEPKITFVTVQKRHRTRFTLNDGNVPPGTVVNTTITQEPEREFFLCSHTPVRGTARPAHYRVYVDECDLPPERLQEITFSLCHMYARCDTPVSIPAPVYYAHLAAARASCHMKGNPQDTTDPINIAESVKKKMFFV
ncbi:protein argonaute-2-like [Rhipicephalus microplus]|uniref:protein argonaute-2-like n=1 Tax=Rhipicephalus microplus TaxID=6941 RepID=UPI003F6CEBE3